MTLALRMVAAGASIVAAAGCTVDREGGWVAAADAGRGVDAFYAARDAGPGVRDGGPGGADAGPGGVDAGPPPRDAGPPDAGCVARTWYPDADGDGFGGATPMPSCTLVAGHVEVAGDCNDANAGIRPGATETCDGVDQDCDGMPDDGATCPAGCVVRDRDRRAYLFCDRPDRHRDAITSCSGGYALTTIDDAAEDAWVAATARGLRATGWWIGYYDPDEDGIYQWVAGASSYVGWGPREPSGGTEHCALIAWYGGIAMSWNDGDCAFDFPYICEAFP